MRYLIVFFVFLGTAAQAQTILYFNTGVGSYNMGDMKALQRQLLVTFPVEAKITEAFPAFIYYEAGFNIKPHREEFFGLNVGYGSTGGRVSYSDYSGKIKSDQLLRYYFVTASAGLSFTLDEKESWFIRGDFKPGIAFTTLKITADETIGTQSSTDQANFTATSFSVQPSVTAIKRFGRLGVQAEVGYYATIAPGKLMSKEHQDGYLIDDKNNPLHANWSGLRASLGCVVFLNRSTD
ncbi:hypothetical protein [Chryseolinea lacunae]|uniref:Outer membrane protein beta-barrel domain-containing protein n=1 Tax=Chryseolinea lacunae TaxID=2801331 RepID=A0ABS1KWN5_9BACT|nr:hypothetical protein [Chryseolinea lacunae]MBL0743883.1 hypothetical protein [Chryseolinea lacunae]